MARDLGRSVSLIIAIIVSISLTACNLVNTEDRPDSFDSADGTGGGAFVAGASDPAQIAFEATVYPVLSAQLNCNICHGAQTPRVSAAVGTAWGDIVGGNYIQEGLAPANNPIVLEIAAGHNGNGPAQAAVIEAAIADWQSQMALIPTEDLIDYGDDSLVYYFEE